MYFNPALFYDPRKGNLLLDLTVPEPRLDVEDYNEFPLFSEVVATAGDALSRVAAADMNAVEADLVDSAGLVALFWFAPLPQLYVSSETNGIQLVWSTDPRQSRLQVSTQVGAESVWKDFPADHGNDQFWRVVTVPSDQLTKQQFFRLCLETTSSGGSAAGLK
ncbi:MAG: hypothetical protein JNN07_27520 [Verrucomicrobiales bacterium]|nr:hypothetical protein [Verrucomicrobiales bacterium]